MGFFRKIWKGIKTAGRFAGKVIGKVGNVAGVLAPIASMIHPTAGAVVSTVARGAQRIGKIADGFNNAVNKGEEIGRMVKPGIDKMREGAKAVYKTGIPDKLTRGGFTRVLNKGRALRDRIERKYDQAAGHAAKIGGGINRGLEQVATHGNRIRAAIEKGRMVGTAQRPAHLPPPNPNLP